MACWHILPWSKGAKIGFLSLNKCAVCNIYMTPRVYRRCSNIIGKAYCLGVQPHSVPWGTVRKERELSGCCWPAHALFFLNSNLLSWWSKRYPRAKYSLLVSFFLRHTHPYLNFQPRAFKSCMLTSWHMKLTNEEIGVLRGEGHDQGHWARWSSSSRTSVLIIFYFKFFLARREAAEMVTDYSSSCFPCVYLIHDPWGFSTQLLHGFIQN